MCHRYRKRYVLFAGVLIFAGFLVVMSQFVWSIEVVGLEHTKQEEVLLAAEAAGVRIGALRRDLKNGEEIQNIMRNRLPDVAWSWIYFEGTRATIQVKEKILPPVLVDKKTPCDIVARRDGLIRQVTVKNGIGLTEPGMAVEAGDVIIAGTLTHPTTGEERLVHAMGAAAASTWHEKTGEYKLYHEIRKSTGAKITQTTLNLFSKKVNLFQKSGIPYAEYDIIEDKHELVLGKNHYLGIGFETVAYQEVEVIREPISTETAVELARQDLEARIAAELLPGAVRKTADIQYEQLDAQTIRVTLTMEFLEQIGTERPIGIYQTE